MDCAKLCAAHSAGKDWLKFGTLLIRRVNYFVNCWKETLKFHDPKLIAALETFWALPSNAKESDFREMEGEGSGGAARKVLAERTLNFFSANSKEALARGLAVKEKIKFDNALNNLLKSGGDEVTRESLLQAIRKELPALPLQQAQQHLRRSFRHKVNSLRCLGQKVVMELLKVTDGSGAKDPTEQKSAKRRKIADNETSQIPKKQDRCTVERNRSTRCRKPQLQRPWKPSDTFLTCFGFEMLRMPLSLGVRRLSVLLAVSIILGIHRAFSQPELPKEDTRRVLAPIESRSISIMSGYGPAPRAPAVGAVAPYPGTVPPVGFTAPGTIPGAPGMPCGGVQMGSWPTMPGMTQMPPAMPGMTPAMPSMAMAPSMAMPTMGTLPPAMAPAPGMAMGAMGAMPMATLPGLPGHLPALQAAPAPAPTNDSWAAVAALGQLAAPAAPPATAGTDAALQAALTSLGLGNINLGALNLGNLDLSSLSSIPGLESLASIPGLESLFGSAPAVPAVPGMASVANPGIVPSRSRGKGKAAKGKSFGKGKPLTQDSRRGSLQVQQEIHGTLESFGYTILSLAASNGMVAVCKAILDHPEFTQVNSKDLAAWPDDKWGATALHWAAASNLGSVCTSILEHPAFVEAHVVAFSFKFENQTALQVAEERGCSDAEQAIKKALSVLTSADLQRAAKRLNVELRENTAGPWYQIELYSGDRQLGKTSGWAQPWGSLHLETIEVRKFTGYWVAKPANARPGESQSEEAQEATEAEEKKRYADVAKVARWFGLLLSCAIACWNRERSPFYCKEAYLLAIKDEEKQHESLVRYYKGLGFKTIKDPETLEYQDQVLSVGVGVDQMWIRCGTLGLRLDASMENRIPKLLGGQRPKK
eukprot:s972_g29.t2